ncbi:MAG TPA: CusA/CzcA family heavy metal efflux RND transporter [Rhodothermales bacterium]|nr:CusA/CzcA family heavy metal efflux RND transporter [Rhodothermales bacterium]
MLKKLIAWSATNRLLVVIVTVIVSMLGVWAMLNTPVDAIPDLSDVQVIIRTEYPGQGPDIVEEQVTYPLTSAMLAVPYANTVRGFSMFGTSFVYVIFEDGTDLYWARSRVLEYLNTVTGRLPDGVRPEIGPDATGVGWVYQYSLVDTTGTYDLSELRSIQDFFLRYELQSVPGVAEVATVGGFVKQYQIVVEPQALAGFGISISQIREALSRSNRDVGGRLLEIAESEFMVRGRGYLKGIADIKNVPLRTLNGTTVSIGDVADVQLGPDIRRGIAEKNGEGEVVGGVIVMRYGENAQKVINGVKSRIVEIEASLPQGVQIVEEYDRSRLIGRAVDNLSRKITEELLIVTLIVILFLLHVRSAFVALVTIPVGILMALLVMYLIGVSANIMSLGGIAIAIGVMVDASLVMVENAHKHIERERARLGAELSPADRTRVVVDAAVEVGPSLFFSLLIVTVSFLPVFSLQQVEGRLFTPLALTKTFAMAAASILAVTLVPALMVIFIRGKIRNEDRNPIARFFIRGYRPVIRQTLLHPNIVLVLACLILVASLLPVQRLAIGEVLVPFPQIGSEFMPDLNEGDLLYMPTTLPGVSPQKAKELLQQTDRIIASFPEVKSVFGKIGRAETATDPAPLSMVETTVILKPQSEWREGLTIDGLIRELDRATQIPGLSNIWTMPIKNRIDMLATGIRSPVGIKIAGEDLKTLERIGIEIEAALRGKEGVRSVQAERAVGGNFIDVNIDRLEAARYGLRTDDVQDVIATAIGGIQVATTVEGLARYPVNIRYPRELRGSVDALGEVLVPTPAGAHIPLDRLADIKLVSGASMIKSENARPNAVVFIDIERGADLGGFIERAREIVAEEVTLPPGYSLKWSGQFEYLDRANRRLRLLIPITLAIVFLLLYLHFRNVTETIILMATLPFAMVGAVWLMVLLNFNMSIAVGVGIIAVVGLAAETGVVMQVYLDEAMGRYRREGRLTTMAQLNQALEEGAVDRVRPKLMTVFTTIIGLLPIMYGTGTGSEVMKRIATPMVGGLVSSTVLTLVLIPAIYAIVYGNRMRRRTDQTTVPGS